MNDDLRDLQELWQGQESHTKDVSEMIQSLNAFEAKLKKEKRRLQVLFPGTMLFLLALTFLFPMSIYYLIGIGLIGIAMMMILLLVYRNSYPNVSPDQDLSNKEFLQDTIDKLKGRKLITSRYMYIYTFLLVLGINLAYVEVLQEAGMIFRIFSHGFVTVILPIANIIAIRKREGKNNKELDPLIDQLERLKLAE
ncbi:MAG: hypothetical protein MRZ79_18950 [Bacteroidia bacterium]|nr:hypothetical protein [Bacteroidia bacterium]